MKIVRQKGVKGKAKRWTMLGKKVCGKKIEKVRLKGGKGKTKIWKR